MRKEKTWYIIWGLFYLFAFIVLATSTSPTTESTEKVRIDSVYSKPRYEVMPELVWFYTTKRGLLTSNVQKYKVGDSIEVKIIKINETNNQK